MLFVPKELEHFEKDSCWRQHEGIRAVFSFLSPMMKAKWGRKNSVRLEENRGECYKDLDTVGIFVAT